MMRIFQYYRIGLLLCMLGLCFGHIQAESWASKRSIVTVHSLNRAYKVVSVPYSNILEARWGKTNVYDTRTSNLLYSIPECLTEGYLFISDDGTTVAHIIDREYGTDTSKYVTHAVNLYRNGKVFKRISLKELTHCDTCGNNLFFYAIKDFTMHDGEYQPVFIPNTSPRDSFLTYNPTFLFQDTVLIYTSTRRLIELSLLSGQLKDTVFETFTMQQLSALSPVERNTVTFESSNRRPKLIDNGSYDAAAEALAEAFNMKTDMYENGNRDRYKYYRIYAMLSIDRTGHANIIELSNQDGLPDTQLREAILGFKYVFPENIPNEIGCWYQEFYAFMRNSNKRVAEKERRLEKKKEHEAYLARLTADSINGVYIPRDLEDCFHQLDTLLSSQDLRTIKNYESSDEMINLHFGLGMWMRNNWGLWGGSRLQKYCLQRGLRHPDYMSDTILRYYWEYLHGIHDSWRAFDAEAKKSGS